MKKIILIIICMLVVIGLGVGAYVLFFEDETPEQMVEEVFDSMNSSSAEVYIEVDLGELYYMEIQRYGEGEFGYVSTGGLMSEEPTKMLCEDGEAVFEEGTETDEVYALTCDDVSDMFDGFEKDFLSGEIDFEELEFKKDGDYHVTEVEIEEEEIMLKINKDEVVFEFSDEFMGNYSIKIVNEVVLEKSEFE